MSDLRNRASTTSLLLLTAGVAAIAIFAHAYSPVTIDDAPITWRYAENLAAGKGMVYNEGERVLGTSTPLFTLLLALARLVGLPVPAAAQGLSLAASLLAIGVYYALARKLISEGMALWTGLFLIGNGLLASQSSWGMETGLYVLLAGLAFLLHAHGRNTLAIAVAGLCLLTRLDGLIVGVVLLGALALERRRIPWRQLALYVAFVLPWLLFAQIYFGSFLPQSMMAKAGHVLVTERLWLVAIFLAPPLVVYLPFLAIGAGSLAACPSSPWRALPLLAWLVLYATAFILFPVDPYPWYFTPLLVPAAVVIGVGIDRVLVWAGRWCPIAGSIYRSGAALFLVALLAYSTYHGYLTISYWKAYVATYEAQRVEIGLWLRDNTPPASAIATAGIGQVGYYSQRRIVDLGGLVTPMGGLYAVRDWQEFEPDLILYTVGGEHPQGDWTAFQPSPMRLGWDTRADGRCDTLVHTWARAKPAGGTYYLYRVNACP
ncbi:MAG: hypothetical protein JXA93_02880 [Anaerolineae bacterium]|nr:hypothetical protein [Anaerolineae bacterium]